VLPLAWNGLLSLQYWSPLKPARWAGLDHYEEMLLYDDVFWQALTNTLIFIAVSPLAIALALGIALLVNGNLKGAAIYRSIVFLSYPLMIGGGRRHLRWMYDATRRHHQFCACARVGSSASRSPSYQSFEWGATRSVNRRQMWQVLGFYHDHHS
jgi:ABC-type sugar transport system permease subunit